MTEQNFLLTPGAGFDADRELAQAQSPIPLRDFFRNLERSHFSVSPDGQMLAYLQAWEGRMNIHVQPLPLEPAVPPVRLTGETTRDIQGFAWKGPRRLIYLKDSDGDEINHLLVVDVQTQQVQDMTPLPGVRAEIIAELRDEPDHLLVGLNQRDNRVFDAYRLDLRTGELTLVAQNPGTIETWCADHNGVIRAAIAREGLEQCYLYREGPDAPFQVVLTTGFRDSFEPQLFSGDNRRLYVLSNLGRNTKALVEVDPATAREEAVLYVRDDVDVDGVEYSYHRHLLTAVSYITTKPELTFLDPESEALQQELTARLPGYEVRVRSRSDDEQTLVIAASNDRTYGARYLYQRVTGTLTPLGELAPWLPEQRMAAMTPIAYAARDGLTIHGYLTLPPGAQLPVPVVVHPHGGPWTRDVWGFQAEVQFLASRGYAVLQMNFRGSTGYGRRFWEASFQQWGLAMQDDISDGVRYLIEQGIADPERIAIYGGSYGGYATLAGLAFTPELYACGIDYVGVANLLTFMNSMPSYWELQRPMFYTMIGDPVADRESMAARSPALQAKRIVAPVLVVQGARDPRVNIDESNQMVNALRARGVEVEYLVKENEGHGFLNKENKFDFYAAVERFLAKHLAPATG